MTEGNYARTGRSGGSRRGRTGVARLSVLAVAMISALLVSTSTAGSQADDPPFFAELGTLELQANDSDGDRFVFTPVGGGSPVIEGLSSNNKSRLADNIGADLVTLTPTGRGSGSQLYVGLKDHRIGVRGQGEGNGTPAVQINNFGVPAKDQTLTIELNGPDLGDGAATLGQIGLKMKFGATASLQPLFEGAAVGSATLVECAGGSSSDCGPDSNGDLKVGAVGDGTYLFDAVEISIDSPDDGAVSLVSRGTETTWFDIAEPLDYDLSVTKVVDVVDDEGPVVGDTVTYSVTVAYKAGNLAAPLTGISVKDILPDGVTTAGAEPATATSGSYAVATGIWSDITLGPTVDAILTIPVRVEEEFDDGEKTAGVTITNTASLSDNDTRDDDDNDSASVDITPVDGILSCDFSDDSNLAEQTSGGLSSDFRRLDVDLVVDLSNYPVLESDKVANVTDGCGTRIPYTQDIDEAGGVIEFAPDDPDLIGLYRGELSFPAGTGADIVLALTSDNGTDSTTFSELRGCPVGVVDGAGEPAKYATADGQLAGFFPEMGVSGNYPQLPDEDVAVPADRNVSCVVSYGTVAGGVENWVLLVAFDPRYR